jgi:predicted nucleotidyltransferase component of viral defense system
MGNIRLADVYSIMAMKMEVMLRRMKLRDYYDIYAILREGYDISRGIEAALKYSAHKLSTKNIVMMLLSDNFTYDENFGQLEPKYKVSKAEIREYILHKLKDTNLT